MLIGMLFIGRRCFSAGIRLLSDNVLDDCLNIEHRDAVVVQSAGIWMQGCWGLSSGTLLEFRRGCLQLRLAIRNGQKMGRVVWTRVDCMARAVIIQGNLRAFSPGWATPACVRLCHVALSQRGLRALHCHSLVVRPTF